MSWHWNHELSPFLCCLAVSDTVLLSWVEWCLELKIPLFPASVFVWSVFLCLTASFRAQSLIVIAQLLVRLHVLKHVCPLFSLFLFFWVVVVYHNCKVKPPNWAAGIRLQRCVHFHREWVSVWLIIPASMWQTLLWVHIDWCTFLMWVTVKEENPSGLFHSHKVPTSALIFTLPIIFVCHCVFVS